ncbi:hypothetical protein ILYODFUR_023758, partial [Ilyodon furcidens]
DHSEGYFDADFGKLFEGKADNFLFKWETNIIPKLMKIASSEMCEDLSTSSFSGNTNDGMVCLKALQGLNTPPSTNCIRSRERLESLQCEISHFLPCGLRTLGVAKPVSHAPKREKGRTVSRRDLKFGTLVQLLKPRKNVSWGYAPTSFEAQGLFIKGRGEVGRHGHTFGSNFHIHHLICTKFNVIEPCPVPNRDLMTYLVGVA